MRKSDCFRLFFVNYCEAIIKSLIITRTKEDHIKSKFRSIAKMDQADTLTEIIALSPVGTNDRRQQYGQRATISMEQNVTDMARRLKIGKLLQSRL